MFEKGKFYWWKHAHEGAFFVHKWDCPVMVIDSNEENREFLFFCDFDKAKWKLDDLKDEEIREISESEVYGYFTEEIERIKRKLNKKMKKVLETMEVAKQTINSYKN